MDDAVKADPEYEPAQQAIELAEQQYKAARDAYASAAKSNADANSSSKSTPTHSTPSAQRPGHGEELVKTMLSSSMLRVDVVTPVRNASRDCT